MAKLFFQSLVYCSQQSVRLSIHPWSCSAEVRRQTFLIAIYRVWRSDVDKKRQTEVISKILEANKVLYLELQIVRFQQLKNAEKPGPQRTAKTISTLVVELLIQEGVNEVVAKGIVGGGNLFKYERQEKDRIFRQYFRYIKYDYRLYYYKEEVVYGQYLGLYNIRNHPEGNTTKKYPLYSGLYAAQEIACPYRKKELEKGKLRLKKKAAYFDTADLRITARRGETDRVEEFTLVTSKQTKKRITIKKGEQVP